MRYPYLIAATPTAISKTSVLANNPTGKQTDTYAGQDSTVGIQVMATRKRRASRGSEARIGIAKTLQESALKWLA